MKLKLKVLVAAVALATSAAGSAIAADTNATGGSDLLFYVVDGEASTSFVYNLGLSNAFNPNTTTISQNITGTAWTNFKNADTNWMANAQWGVVQAMNGTVGTLWLGTSVGPNGTGTPSAVNITNAVSQVQLLFTNNAGVNTSGTATFASGNGTNNAVAVWGDPSRYGANIPQNASWAIGAPITGTVDFAKFQSVSGRGAAQQIITYNPTNGNGFAFDGTTLSYNVAPVPEPETYAMLLGGLLMLAAVARRRGKQ